MVYVTKFRANDLNPSKGKQIEFNAGVVQNFFAFTEAECMVSIECRSLADKDFEKLITATLKLSPARGDYKIYQNDDGSKDLKDVFLVDLSLTAQDNIDDYYAIKKKSDDEYVLYYVPKDLLFKEFFPSIKDDLLIANVAEQKSVSAGEVSTWQQIVYGAPGTGKSFGTEQEIKASGVDEKKDVFRTTFHPDSDYSTFVGAYKPTKEIDPYETVIKVGTRTGGHISQQDELVRKSEITYDFVPQTFVRAYVAAWKNMSAPDDDLKVKPVYLVIEEINRGNCAQIFGDLFQLLDRNDAGFSDYPIDADHDLERFLAKNDQLGALCAANIVKCGTDSDLVAQIIQGKKLSLPPNLFIRATMNTSDQSLFPIDSAFKRRWDWEYVPIKDEKKGWYVEVGETKYEWWSFLKKINDIVYDETQSADKQMGYFFVKLCEGQTKIDLKKFVNKVAFYLWNDVFKDCEIRKNALKLKDANGQYGEPIKFADFFMPHSAEVNVKVVKDLFVGLGVEEIKPEGGTDDSSAAALET